MNTNRLALIFGVVVLCMGVGMFYIYSNKVAEQNLRLQKEQELRLKTSELAQLTSNLESLARQKKEMEDNLNAKVESLNQLTKDYEENIKTQSDKISFLSAESENLRRDKDNQTKKIAQLTKRVQLLEKEKSSLTKKIADLSEMQPEYGEELDDESDDPVHPGRMLAKADAVQATALKEEPVKLGNIVVQKSSGKAASIQNVNKLYGFVIINAGIRDGVDRNQVVNIIRDQKIIGKAIVEKVRDNMSAAVVIPEWSRDEVRIGDMVSRI